MIYNAQILIQICHIPTLQIIIEFFQRWVDTDDDPEETVPSAGIKSSNIAAEEPRDWLSLALYLDTFTLLHGK